MQILSPSGGLLMLVAFFVLMFGLTHYLTQTYRTREGFLAANRKLGLWQSGFSIAATWIWAPALFVSSQQAYLMGHVGLFWFMFANVLCLVLFSEFAVRLRERMPTGYTLSEYMAKRYSQRVQNIYLVQFTVLMLFAFGVQLLAGGLIFTTLTGLPFFWVTVIMSIIALSYSICSGLKASVITDHLQLGIILVFGSILVGWTVYAGGGLETVKAGMDGISGEYTSIFAGKGAMAFWSFGLAYSLALFAGPIADQMFWQRSLAIKRKYVRKSFLYSALIFALVPLMLGTLGFLGAGAGIQADDPQLVNIQTVQHFLPAWAAIPFAFMLVCGLVSTLDSLMCAVSSLAGSDVAKRLEMTEKNALAFSRFAMVALAVTAIIIANIPDMQILYLMLFYGTLRVSVFVPTMITLISNKVSESGMFWGILLALIFGLPIFGYGNWTDNPVFITGGSLLTLFISSGTVIYMSYLRR